MVSNKKGLQRLGLFSQGGFDRKVVLTGGLTEKDCLECEFWA